MSKFNIYEADAANSRAMSGDPGIYNRHIHMQAFCAAAREREREREAAQSVLDTFGSGDLSQQSQAYLELVDEVRKWMPVAAGGMGIDPNVPPGTAPAPDIHHKPPTPDQVKAEYRRVEREAAVFRAIARPQAMRVGVFTVR
jgi:hypothetical protein